MYTATRLRQHIIWQLVLVRCGRKNSPIHNIQQDIDLRRIAILLNSRLVYLYKPAITSKMSASHASLGAAADERKARLAKLKSLKRKQPTDEDSAPENPHSPAPPSELEADRDSVSHLLSGRNYDAATRGPKLGFEAPPTATLIGPTLEQQAQAIEESLRAQEQEEAAKADEGVDLFKLQPKKPNWDFKRDLGRLLEVLDVRTDNAIAGLVRERIAGKQKKGLEEVAAKGGAVAGGGEEIGMEGAMLVEGLREREREDEEDRRREREDEELP